MAKKSTMREAADAVKSVAGSALGAAAIAATGVVLQGLAGALGKGEEKVHEATPAAQKAMGELVSKPMLPAREKKRAAPKRRTKTAKKKTVPKKPAVKKKGSVKRRGRA
jgi:hypothetical protein